MCIQCSELVPTSCWPRHVSVEWCGGRIEGLCAILIRIAVPHHVPAVESGYRTTSAQSARNDLGAHATIVNGMPIHRPAQQPETNSKAPLNFTNRCLWQFKWDTSLCSLTKLILWHILQTDDLAGIWTPVLLLYKWSEYCNHLATEADSCGLANGL